MEGKVENSSIEHICQVRVIDLDQSYKLIESLLRQSRLSSFIYCVEASKSDVI